ncbi:MAG TPA: polyamine aminopropyltransferase [Oscillospiraceae bacterium]|nr:polyamine aminopropyltransferase [Oscillospiraceae bacterium]HPF55258.1 polyamine aminopropyltransferase [Clostridiales bacterium]HPK36016.1 polyamine aminopropyltransferase [Oscillospiraceae bacterium]HPR76311.1 polyamine aminopropyltransferase [Oscillospiraceae bacterium]
MDDLWYSEYHAPTVRFSIKVKSQLYHEKSDYQDISVFDSVEFGRFLTLDGIMMLTERDEFIYHEMITHPAMAVNPEIKNVLVIGAGDGGVARELIKYKHIQQIDVVEIDERVVTVCKEYLPKTACGFDDPRVQLHFQDGLKFVRRRENIYDLIIVDSTDPFGPGEVLFTKEFYGSCFNALTENGILVNQHESSFYKSDAKEMQAAHRYNMQVFPVSRLYQAHIPTYPSGHWLFGFASKGLDPINDFKADDWNALGIATRYYNTPLHLGAFALPNYIKELLANG